MMIFRLLTALMFVFVGVGIHAQRIVTLSSAHTETVDALGYGKNIVAVDVTSEYPDYAKKLPRVSKSRTLSAESILSFRPNIVVGDAAMIPLTIQQQLKATGVKLVLTQQQYSVKGMAKFIEQIADGLDQHAKGVQLATSTTNAANDALAYVRQHRPKNPGVLFIYARGAGTMSVAGKGNSLDAIIQLAGGHNVIKEFNDFKPYSTEAMVKSNPDIILMFDFGISSLGGKKAVLAMPGMSLTKAGKSGRIIDMDPHLLINFSVRLPQAILALNRALMQ
ncbi:MAG: ABC transporter substrate-binding protein [Chitinophagaceae bacterium]